MKKNFEQEKDWFEKECKNLDQYQKEALALRVIEEMLLSIRRLRKQLQKSTYKNEKIMCDEGFLESRAKEFSQIMNELKGGN